jgi:hypothetical protein
MTWLLLACSMSNPTTNFGGSGLVHPVVVETTPTAGAIDVDPSLDRVRVVFSAPMRDQSWSFVSVNPDLYPNFQGDPEYVDDRTVEMAVELEPERDYLFWLNMEPYLGFRDVSGIPAVPYQLSFRTGPE